MFSKCELKKHIPHLDLADTSYPMWQMSQMSKRVVYFQGMNYLAAHILLVVQDEERTFWILMSLLHTVLPGFFAPGMPGLHKAVVRFFPSLHRDQSMKSSPSPDELVTEWYVFRLVWIPDGWVFIQDLFSTLVTKKMPALSELFSTHGVEPSLKVLHPFFCLFWGCITANFASNLAHCPSIDSLTNHDRRSSKLLVVIKRDNPASDLAYSVCFFLTQVYGWFLCMFFHVLPAPLSAGVWDLVFHRTHQSSDSTVLFGMELIILEIKDACEQNE